jgi:2-polyprenyl-3-methyl-5-hydroxy-6-metoxy-1,4-benzoquinol methylase
MLSLPEEITSCTTQDVRHCWNQAQRPSSRFIRRSLDFHREEVHGSALLEVCGDVDGLRVLDLGCGEGWCSRELARRGASVVGVDVSEAQIADASTYSCEGAGLVEYRVMDAAHVDREAWGRTFDLATACMSLQDMREPGAALRATHRVLAPHGRLVCSVPHPFTHMLGGRQSLREEIAGRLWLKVGGYFQTKAYLVPWNLRRTGESWTTIRWSRSLGDYWRLFTGAGFVVRELLEPHPTSVDAPLRPQLRDSAEIPKYLIVVAEIYGSST